MTDSNSMTRRLAVQTGGNLDDAAKQIAAKRVAAGLIPEQGRRIMEAMHGDIPPHAKQERPGRGGKTFTYISHGYVTDKLNEIFGPFWDFQLLAMDNGKMFNIETYTENENGREKQVVEVLVVGQLTIRLFDQNGVLLETIRRTGEGGKVREKNTTMADAIQTAGSDALKRAAFRLGKVFGLQLYYDDEERQEQYLAALNPKPPTNITQLFARVQAEGISEEEFIRTVGMDITDVPERDVVKAWQALVDSRQNKG